VIDVVLKKEDYSLAPLQLRPIWDYKSFHSRTDPQTTKLDSQMSRILIVKFFKSELLTVEELNLLTKEKELNL
jgi:hypothetical protein